MPNQVLRYFYSIVLFSVNVRLLESAKILDISPINSKSHNVIHQAIVKELVSRGHQVISFSYFKSNINESNYEEFQITLENDISFIDSVDLTKTETLDGFWDLIHTARTIEINLCQKLLQMDYVKKLIKTTYSIDLIIIENDFTKCYNLLAYKLNVPLVAISPTSISPSNDHLLGNPFNPSFIPFWTDGVTTNMNFYQRLQNSALYFFYHIYKQLFAGAELKQLSTNILGIELPSENKLIRKNSLLLCNNHPSFISRPNVPNVVDIGGIHIKEPKPLPKDISEFIESAKHGVILFSFGTTIKASSIPQKKIQILINVFSSISQKVLWRVNELNLSNLPSNIKTGYWFPQRDLLEHKNVVAFMSHCGLLGTYEAIYTATPVIAIPFLFDQPQNANILVEKGVAIYIDFEKMTEKTLLNAIQEVTNNQKYKRNMENLSKVFKDRPISALDSAVYWIEYVIKYKGALHLRSRGADMPLHEYLLLDVITFLFILMMSIIYLLKLMTMKIVSSICYEAKQKIQ